MRLIIFIILLSFCYLHQAVNHGNFRKCKDTGFCKRLRPQENPDFVAQHYAYEIIPNTLQLDSSSLSADLLNVKHPLLAPLRLSLQVLKSGVLRFGVREKNPKFPRWEVQDVLSTEAISAFHSAKWSKTNEGANLVYGDNVISVINKPFTVTISIKGQKSITLNSKNLLVLESYRDKNPKPADPVVPAPEEGQDPAAQGPPSQQLPNESLEHPYDEQGMWDESWSTHTDSKPRGPSGLSLDVSFIGSSHIYGIPEHASNFALKNTKSGGGGYEEPYRLWNLDVFEYELDVPMALYGTVPFLISHDADKSVGMLWLNSGETYVDISDSKSDWGKEGGQKKGYLGNLLGDTVGGLLGGLIGNPQKDVQWLSESGVIDAFFFLGPSPKDVFSQYTDLTGKPALPQRFAIAYHQCRWNYKSEDDVAQVDSGFDEHDIPYDVLWLDIEHTDGKKYFTWDRSTFPTPADMQNKLSAKGRKMVTIVDPHIKRDSGYRVHTDAERDDLYIKNPTSKGGVYEGWCWPGSVSYLDFLAPRVRDYWASQFALNKYEGSTQSLYTWNDMNEPSVFNGPEVSMPKDCLHLGGTVEHRDAHNLYGFYQQMATAQGHRDRDNARPFVLSRAFYAGSQKYGAIWTGDNRAEWKHLAASAPMLLSLNVAGITFSGADVGGFFGDPDTELLVRWYQAGAFQPFFRGHAHIDTKRREPWLFGEPTTTLIRNAIRTRYTYLPYVYTTFHEASISGTPVMRPLWVEFPKDEESFGIENEWLLGSDLLIKPVTENQQRSTTIYLPGQTTRWYELGTWSSYPGQYSVTVNTPLEKIPVFQRGGSIIPKRERARRNSALMENDPFTLVVALDSAGKAEGSLYLDDGHTFNYAKGDYIYRKFTFANNVLSSTKGDTAPQNTYKNTNTIERIVVVGISAVTKAVLKVPNKSPVELTIISQSPISSTSSASLTRLTVRKPDTLISSDWSIEFS